MTPNPDLTFYFTIGLPACGKSSWARKQMANMAATKVSVMRINNDELRRMLHDNQWSGKNEKMIDASRDALVSLAFNRRINIILDNTHLNPYHQKKYSEWAEQQGYRFEVVDFTTGPLAVSVDECLRRDRERTGWDKVGDAVIWRMYNQYLRPKENVDATNEV